MEETSDIFLYRRLKQNDSKAFDLIYRRYWEKLYAFGHGLTGSKEQTENIIQDLFVRLWEKREDVEIINLKGYLFQSFKYQFYQQYKQGRLKLDRFQEELEDYLIDNMNEGHPEIMELLSKAIESLPPKRKEILVMSKLRNMRASEIGEALDLSTQTVRNQLSKALQQLRSSMGEYYFADMNVVLLLFGLLLGLLDT